MSNATQPKRQAKRPPYGGVMSSLAHSKAGSVLPIYAVGTLVLAGLVGGGVDMARAYQAERRLQAACDSGALAGRRAVGTNGFDDAAEEQADRFFNVNFDPSIEQTSDTTFTATSPDDGSSVIGAATATLPTVIMPIFGFKTIDLSVECTASMGVGNSDVMFVLDTTGSMRFSPAGVDRVPEPDTRMRALKNAMKAFYTTVEQSTSGGNARVRYGFVPYSSAVNVGQILTDLDSNYIADTSVVQTRQAVNWGPVVDTWTAEGTPTQPSDGNEEQYSSTKYKNETLCKNAKPSDEANWRDYGSYTFDDKSTFDPNREQLITAKGVQQEQRRAKYDCLLNGNRYYIYRIFQIRTITSYNYEARNPIPVTTNGSNFTNWIYRPVEYDTRQFKTFASTSALVAQSGSRAPFSTRRVTETWDGCIIERQTTPAETFNFVSLATGIAPAAATDLDIDAAPTADISTQWRPLWEAVAYQRSTELASLEGWTSTASYACPQASRTLAEMTETEFDDYVEALQPFGGTYHDIGMLWGARLASTTGIFADNVNEDPDNGGNVSRHMIFMTDGDLAPELHINSSYGIEAVDRRITGNGRAGQLRTRHRARFLALCEAVKARGIRLWVIGFGTDLDEDSQADMTACASPDSSFQSNDSSQLHTTFQEIANQVGELRIVQ